MALFFLALGHLLDILQPLDLENVGDVLEYLHRADNPAMGVFQGAGAGHDGDFFPCLADNGCPDALDGESFLEGSLHGAVGLVTDVTVENFAAGEFAFRFLPAVAGDQGACFVHVGHDHIEIDHEQGVGDDFFQAVGHLDLFLDAGDHRVEGLAEDADGILAPDRHGHGKVPPGQLFRLGGQFTDGPGDQLDQQEIDQGDDDPDAEDADGDGFVAQRGDGCIGGIGGAFGQQAAQYFPGGAVAMMAFFFIENAMDGNQVFPAVLFLFK
ncbi:hypothetical protein BMS3Abin13_00553 [bacterium BMS3Abin13]|nr:hypothetical protein BMS3Abin13_00553 [bacterium BMS3Abin13]